MYGTNGGGVGGGECNEDGREISGPRPHVSTNKNNQAIDGKIVFRRKVSTCTQKCNVLVTWFLGGGAFF